MSLAATDTRTLSRSLLNTWVLLLVLFLPVFDLVSMTLANCHFETNFDFLTHHYLYFWDVFMERGGIYWVVPACLICLTILFCGWRRGTLKSMLITSAIFVPATVGILMLFNLHGLSSR